MKYLVSLCLLFSSQDQAGPVSIEGGSLLYDRWIVDQLADMRLRPADIDFAIYSHLHFDHAGAANAFVDSEVLMQRREWDAAFGKSATFTDTKSNARPWR